MGETLDYFQYDFEMATVSIGAPSQPMNVLDCGRPAEISNPVVPVGRGAV